MHARRHGGRSRRRLVIGALAMLGSLVPVVGPFTAAEAAPSSPPFIPADAPWLPTVNYYRAVAGLAPVTENPTYSAGALQHSCYMLANGISHDEIPGLPGYTDTGRAAGLSGNVAVTSAFNATARSHIELWMSGPFHAVGVLRPSLSQVGFGKCDRQDTPMWHSGATLDVLRGLGPRQPLGQPILFPGNGSTTSLDRFQTESPNPLDSCPGWTAPAGLPVLAMMPESTAGATASISGPGGPLATCTVTGANSTGVAKSILDGDNVVVAIPRSVLPPGTYSVAVRTNARTVNWSFRVDPGAMNGVTPAPQASPLAGDSGFQPLTPARIVDTRTNRGSAPFGAQTIRRIQITGSGGVPPDATAVVANVTSTESTAAGFVTLWNCAATRPTASNLNFTAGQNVPNSATIPLDAGGGICVYTYAPTQLVIDVTGFYSASATGRYNPVMPTRVVDTRIPLGPTRRLGAGQTMELHVTGSAGVPADAMAVALNVTADNPSADGVITVYPCDRARPEASSLNPAIGTARANLVVSAVSSSGTVCVHTMYPTELLVDVFGWFGRTGARLQSTVPFRFTDTREIFNAELNAGNNGLPLSPGQILEIPMAGHRGIPAGATAISANITAADESGPGWVAAWPCAGGAPGVSNVNYRVAEPVANAAALPLSSRGSICVMSYTWTHVIVDVNGWWM